MNKQDSGDRLGCARWNRKRSREGNSTTIKGYLLLLYTTWNGVRDSL